MIHQLEFYQNLILIENGQTISGSNASNILKKRRYIKNRKSYIKGDDEPPMTDAERRRWLKEMNERGF